MPNVDQIPDDYIDSVVKANQTGVPDPSKTSGAGMRDLLKRIRNRISDGSNVPFNYVSASSAGLISLSGGLEKIILTRDVILDALPAQPGAFGQLIVVQDADGFHNLGLANGNKGNIAILRQPGTATLLTWRNDDSFTYFTQEELTPEIIISPPAAITDLKVINIDTIGVSIQWTAPSSNPSDPLSEKVDKYKIYYANSIISSDTVIENLSEYRNTIDPLQSGGIEKLNLRGLKPNTYYAIVIESQKTIFGVVRTSSKSNVVQFKTLSVDADIFEPEWIPVDEVDYYTTDTQSYDFVQNNDLDVDPSHKIHLDLRWPFNYSNVTYSDGFLSGLPDNSAQVNGYGNFFNSWYNTPVIKTVIKLDSVYDIYKIHWLGVGGINFNFKFRTSLDGLNWSLAVDSDSTPQDLTNQKKWAVFDTLETGRYNCRYISLEINTPFFAFKGLAFFGKKASNVGRKGMKFKRLSTPKEFTGSVGSNTIGLIEDLTNLRQVGKFNRFYQNLGWYYPPGINMDKGSTIDPLAPQWCFSTAGVWDVDEQLRKITQDLGMKVLFTVSDYELNFLAEADYSDNSGYRKSINRGLTLTLENTLNPLNWSQYARFVYNFVARYGHNPNADPQYLSVWQGDPSLPDYNRAKHPETIKVGLGFVEYWEFSNEIDKTWKNDKGHYIPEEAALRESVTYDGHKGLLGAGYGMKSADPNAKLVMAGKSNPNPGYMREMLKWWDVNRGAGDYPISVINIHYYNGNWGSQSKDQYDYSVEEFNAPPEWGFQRETMKAWVELRDTLAPNLELWVTEIGYDEQNDGEYAPNIDDMITRHVSKGQWLIRSFVMCKAWGVDNIFQYFFRHQNANDVFSNTTNAKSRDAFLTSGYMCPEFSGPEYFNSSLPTEAWWYMTAFRNEIEGYAVTHIVTEGGVAVATGNPIVDSSPWIYAVAFKNLQTDETALLAWLAPIDLAPFLNQQKSLQTQVQVDGSEISVDVVDFIDAHITKTKAGNITKKLSVLGGDSLRRVNITLTETPILIKTKNVGFKALQPPEKLFAEALGTDSIRLTWVDRNIGINHTKILMSTQNDQNFQLIYDDYVDDGSFTLNTGLVQGKSYYFKIYFELNGLVSTESGIVDAQLGSVVVTPSNFRLSSKTSISITVDWDYGAADQSNITGFQIFRSSSADGTYTMVGSVAQDKRSYKDIGLIASTQYFYKVRAASQFDVSGFTLAYGFTTDTASSQAPVANRAQIGYNGDSIKIECSLPLSNPTGNNSAFQVIENPDTSPRVLNVIGLRLHPDNAAMLFLDLDNSVLTPNSIIHVSYSGAAGTISSLFNIKLLDVNNMVAENRFNDSSMIEATYQINITIAGHLSPANSGWVDAVWDSGKGGQQPYYNFIDPSAGGIDENVAPAFLMPYNNNSDLGPTYSSVDYYRDNQGRPNNIGDPLPIDFYFPRFVSDFGVPLTWWQPGTADSWSAVLFLNADPGCRYNVRLHASANYYGSTFVAQTQLFGDSATITSFTVNDPLETGILLKNIAPRTVNTPTIQGDGYPHFPNLEKPKLWINVRAVAANGGLMGAIIQQLKNDGVWID